MYLSQLKLDPRARRVQAELSNTYELHRTILSAFPSDLPTEERILYRLEYPRRQNHLNLLVQSLSKPDWEHLHQVPYFIKPPELKSFEPELRKGQMLHFRLDANPTKRIKNDEGKSKRVGLYKMADQQEWMHRKAQQNGFQISLLQIQKIDEQTAFKAMEGDRKRRLKHLIVRFEGQLIVVDPQKMEEAVRNGIGSAKGFGCGLLSLAPLSTNQQ